VSEKVSFGHLGFVGFYVCASKEKEKFLQIGAF
jgi:hypothetical protein